MSQKQGQILAQKQKLIQKLQLTPEQIQLLALVERPIDELREYVMQQIEKNPALDEGTISNESLDEQKSHENDYDPDFDDDDISPFYRDYNAYNEHVHYFNDPTPPPDLAETLIAELKGMMLKKEIFELCAYLCYNLDRRGYFPDPDYVMLDNASNEFDRYISQEEFAQAKSIIQSLEPYGVGASDIKECLLIQIEHLLEQEHEQKQIAIKIVSSYLEELSKEDIAQKIAQKEGLQTAEVERIMEFILSLNPSPGDNFAQSALPLSNQTTPDVEIDIIEGRAEASLNSYAYIPVKMNEEFVESRNEVAKRNHKEEDLKAYDTYISQAQMFMENLKSRDILLLKVVKAIVDYQQDYFLSGNRASLKPMKQEDIALLTDLHITTISRAVKGKIVHAPWGVVELRSLFTHQTVDNEGNTLSTEVVKEALITLIENEDKRNPLSDEQLVKALNEQGFNIARRTVAKYREQAEILTKRERTQR